MENCSAGLGSASANRAARLGAEEPQTTLNPPPQAAAPAVPAGLPPAMFGTRNLPDDVLPQIGKFTTLEDLGRLAGTSKPQLARANVQSTTQHMYSGYQELLPRLQAMQHAVSQCFEGLTTQPLSMTAEFTAACGPLLRFLSPNQRTWLVDAAVGATPPMNQEAITGLLVGMAHLNEPDRLRLRAAVREHHIVAGMQHWEAPAIRSRVSQIIDGDLPGGAEAQAHELASLGDGLRFLTAHEFTAAIGRALALPDIEARGIAVAGLCGGLKMLESPQHDDLETLIASLVQQGTAGPYFGKSEAIAGLGQVMKALSPAQRDRVCEMALASARPCVAMAGIAKGIAQLEASEAAPHLASALTFVTDHDHPPGQPVIYGQDIAVAIAGLGAATRHMNAEQRQQLLDAALRCHPTTSAMAIAGLCAGVEALSVDERAQRVEAVLACPPQTRAVAIAGLGPMLEHLSPTQIQNLLVAAVELAHQAAVDQFHDVDADHGHDDLGPPVHDEFFEGLMDDYPDIQNISGLAGIAIGMERMIDVLPTRHHP
jgi:hypothetical protein